MEEGRRRPPLCRLDRDTFRLVLSRLATEDIFQLWLTGDPLLLRGPFGGGLAVESVGLHVKLKKRHFEWPIPSILSKSWTNLNQLALLLEHETMEEKMVQRLAGLSLAALSTRLTKLAISSATIFDALHDEFRASGVSLKTHLPNLQNLYLRGATSPSAALLKELPPLQTLRFDYEQEIRVALISLLPDTITDLELHLRSFTERSRDPRVIEAGFSSNLRRVCLFNTWAFDVVESLPPTLHELLIHGASDVTLEVWFQLLPVYLKILTVKSIPVYFPVSMVRILSLRCPHLEEIDLNLIFGSKTLDLWSDLPRALKSLKCPTAYPSDTIDAQAAPLLPRTLTYIEPKLLPTLVSGLPEGLTTLKLQSPFSFQILPPTLTFLSVVAQMHGESWPTIPVADLRLLPSSLRTLRLYEGRIQGDMTLAKFPPNLTELGFKFSDPFDLTAVASGFPRCLRHLWVDGEFTPAMVDQLQHTTFGQHLETFDFDGYLELFSPETDFPRFPRNLTRLRLPLASELRLEHFQLLPPSLREAHFYCPTNAETCPMTPADLPHLPTGLRTLSLQGFSSCRLEGLHERPYRSRRFRLVESEVDRVGALDHLKIPVAL